MAKYVIVLLVCLCSARAYIEFEVPRKVFDSNLYADVLDEELCEAQMRYMFTNGTMLIAQFVDAGIRTPRGILKGNLVDLGNYHACIGISESFEPSDIEGKYCMVNIPLRQDDLAMPTESEPAWLEFPWTELLPNTRQHKDMMSSIEQIQAKAAMYKRLTLLPETNAMRVSEESFLASQAFRLAVCLPAACTTRQFMDTFLINTTSVGLSFTEEYCRLKDDKPFIPADYAAMAVFGSIALLIIISTSYDLYYNFILKEDPKKANKIKTSFSVFTNTRRLLTFNSAPGALECLDGIRSLAIMWVIVGHTYSTQNSTHFFNNMDIFTWMFSFSAIWIVAAPITVDTFFMLSGLLLVYTSVGKLSQSGLFKNLHLFYLHRLLRMFPILAAGVFLQATLHNHLSDGPEWFLMTEKVERCRTYWWSTLIYMQNYLTDSWCIGPSWYLAVDMQMYFLSPIVLFWVLGKRRSAWIGLSLAILAMLVAATTYNYVNKFPPASFVPTRSAEDAFHYTRYYYVNTLTRGSPFLVGMIFGYVLNICKGKEVHIPGWLVTISWTCAFTVSAGIIYASYAILQMDWNSPFLDGIINSFARPAWAACVGWMIFACTHGYGGPINWFLSLSMWKLPARISFAMYIFHYPIIYVVNSSSTTVTYFSVNRFFYRFVADLAWTLLISFIMTVAIDSPFSTLIKLAMGGGKRTSPKNEDKEITNRVNYENGKITT